MTQQLKTLANGKLVLALEGGYELQGICDAAEMCMKALLGEEVKDILGGTLVYSKIRVGWFYCVF